MLMVRLRVSLQGMNVSQCNDLKSDGNKRVCVCVCECVMANVPTGMLCRTDWVGGLVSENVL